jgi:DNA invertase Pin-like site-specific DNA recombinase
MGTIETAERDAEIVRRADAGESERALARAFGISRTKVWDIKQAAKRAVAKS